MGSGRKNRKRRGVWEEREGKKKGPEEPEEQAREGGREGGRGRGRENKLLKLTSNRCIKLLKQKSKYLYANKTYKCTMICTYPDFITLLLPFELLDPPPPPSLSLGRLVAKNMASLPPAPGECSPGLVPPKGSEPSASTLLTVFEGCPMVWIGIG